MYVHLSVVSAFFQCLLLWISHPSSLIYHRACTCICPLHKVERQGWKFCQCIHVVCCSCMKYCRCAWHSSTLLQTGALLQPVSIHGTRMFRVPQAIAIYYLILFTRTLCLCFGCSPWPPREPFCCKLRHTHAEGHLVTTRGGVWWWESSAVPYHSQCL